MSEPLHLGKPPIGALFVQLADDATAYARAEASNVQASVNNRIGIAKPGVAMIIGGASLVMGSLIALPFGLMVVLASIIGPVWSVISVTLGLCVLGTLLIWGGTRRIKSAFRWSRKR